MTDPSLPATFKLVTEDITRRALHRIYWRGKDPLGASVAAGNRYDCPAHLASPFGVLYLAFDLETCWMETVVRNTMIRAAGTPIPVPAIKMKDRWACEVNASEPITLARFADEALIDLGDSPSNVMGDSYGRTTVWSSLLHGHANPEVDGIYYRSRFKSEHFCVALFERAVARRGLSVHNCRSIDPATSAEAQSFMRRYRIVPT